MTSRPLIQPTHRAIRAYYESRQAHQAQRVFNELNVRSSFERLLHDTGRLHGWTLVAELPSKSHDSRIIPDGTFRDLNSLPRGYWEAKDAKDDLLTEIKRKSAKGYHLTNTIFEDTNTAVLFQGKQEVRRYQIGNPQELAALLNQFYSYTEPDIEGFEGAVEEFKQRVPELARGLVEKIQQAHKDNKKFIAAFDQFFELCRSALNPNIRVEAVDEMLVQHLLTERLFRTIFNNPEFVKRNAIAAEVERVIDALVSRSFDRTEFLKSLDRFYVAIEAAAHSLPEFSDKQHFLNTVYERFFQGYSVKLADTHGIVYTPQEIVNFMCASVAEVLEKEFGKSLASRDVYIVDPCTGTGNFVVNLLGRIPKRDLPRVYKEQLFANEVMLLPYYIAALNIEHAYYDITREYEPFEGLCFVDTLELAEGTQGSLGFMTADNSRRVERQKNAPITVVIGNPPYNMGQLNENDNNKNRQYKELDGRIRETYAKSSRATLKTKLYDAYVKFFRWAVDRLNHRDGIVCFVSNNSFVDQKAFDGMQKHLLQDFTDIFHLDLHGNVRRNPRISGTTHNVFGIQVGVGITIAIRKSGVTDHQLHYYSVPDDWRREEKLAWLVRQSNLKAVDWLHLSPSTWIASQNNDFSALIPIGIKHKKALPSAVDAIFQTYSLGVSTNRDNVVYDYSTSNLQQRVIAFCETYNAEVDRYKRTGKRANGEALDAFLDYSQVKWSRDLKKDLRRSTYAEFRASCIRQAFYRPFTRRYLYLANLLNDTPGLTPTFVPDSRAERENRVICCTNHTQVPFIVQLTNLVPDAAAGGRAGHCFPFYTYDLSGNNRRENITDWALEHFRAHYTDKQITKWDVFHYVYGLLHHPEYREKYAENLKRELPRVSLAKDFWAFARAGKELARMHVEYETVKPYKLKFIETSGVPLSYRVDSKMHLSKDKTSLKVNDSLTLLGIPPEAFEYRLGNRSAIEWVIDQYQYTEDKKSGIVSDPNRSEGPEYIVRLVGRVIQVSLDTVKITKSLPSFD
jgi:predicted helicase